MPEVLTTSSVSLSAALRVLDAAEAHARAIGVSVCLAVADRGGHLVAFARMDGAPLLSSQLAQDKAWTVAAFNGLPTDEWYDVIKDEPPLLAGIVKTDRLVVFGGGVPLHHAGELVGAVGCSGGSAAQDGEIAAKAAAALS